MSAGRRLLFTLALTLAAGVVPAARLAADALADTKARLAVERERIEELVRKGRLEAERLAREGPAGRLSAAEQLEGLLAAVRFSKAFTPARRDQLVALLNADIRRIQSLRGPDRRPPVPSPLPRIIGGDVRKGEEERRIKAARDRVGGIGGILDGRGKALADSRMYRVRTEEGIRNVRLGVLASAIPDGRDIVFPRDWAERMRKKSPAQPLTPRERDTLKALQTVIPAEFRDSSFEGVIDYLQTRTGINILVDKQALMEVGVSYSESKVNLKLKATTRTILKRVLADLGLAYTIKNGDIHVTSIARAREDVTPRYYSIGDLAAVTDTRIPPFIGQMIMLENAQRIITMITQQIEPQSWKVNNPDAPGTIAFEPVTMRLIIRQTAEIHYALRGLR